MANIKKTLSKVNSTQQKIPIVSFIVAVVKKYSDDQAGRQAALLTYYSFLSLFPMLLILTTLTDIIVGSNSDLKNTIIHGLTNYFPLLGSQLTVHVHRLRTSGLVLVIGLIFTVYGTRGVANVFRNGVQDIWQIPKKERDNFPETLYKSLTVIIVGGFGFILASIISGVASNLNGDIDYRVVPYLINIFLLFWLFNFLINFNLPKHIPYKETWAGALIASVGLVILQSLGGIVVAHELKKLDALYSYFALSLGLIFWLYLQIQVLYYAFEVAVVKSYRLWPISLSAEPAEIQRKSN